MRTFNKGAEEIPNARAEVHFANIFSGENDIMS